MTLNDFKRGISAAKPPRDLTPPLASLWWAAKGDWDKAHGIVMKEDSREAAWVHAYLHRVEGDLDNAGYWYRKARRPVASEPLPAEWDAIAADLIEHGQAR
jgi:hypothetical protein